MLKKSIYPKTKRLSCGGDKVYVTEKLDGANLAIFKKDEKIYIAQRNTILCEDEIEEQKILLYKGLYQWLFDHLEELRKELLPNACLCGEWLGMGAIKYDIGDFDKRFYMFAKANVNDDFELYNIIYNHEYFIYPFDSQVIPNFIGVVPDVIELSVLPNKEYMDTIYNKYCAKVGRNVEGFVLNYKNTIVKYVRMKSGQLREHFDREENEK